MTERHKTDAVIYLSINSIVDFVCKTVFCSTPPPRFLNPVAYFLPRMDSSTSRLSPFSKTFSCFAVFNHVRQRFTGISFLETETEIMNENYVKNFVLIIIFFTRSNTSEEVPPTTAAFDDNFVAFAN